MDLVGVLPNLSCMWRAGVRSNFPKYQILRWRIIPACETPTQKGLKKRYT